MLSERWAKARRTFPQLRRNELGERVCRMWGAVGIIFGAIYNDFVASGADLGAMFGSFWGRLEVIWRFRGPNGWRAASWGALGALWGPYGGHLGPFLGAHWGHHGPSWGRQGPSWGHLGAILGRLGPSWGDLGPSWGPLGGLLGCLGARIGGLLGRLGASGSRKGENTKICQKPKEIK